MELEIVRNKEKGVVFDIREKGGLVKWQVKKKKHIGMETWEIVPHGKKSVLAEVRYSPNGLMPGCRIRVPDRTVCLWEKASFRPGYGVSGCQLKAACGLEYPFEIRDGNRAVAGISLLHPGQDVIYDMLADEDDALLYVSMMAGYVLVSRIGRQR